jgi:hypothetical protein
MLCTFGRRIAIGLRMGCIQTGEWVEAGTAPASTGRDDGLIAGRRGRLLGPGHQKIWAPKAARAAPARQGEENLGF